MATSTEATSSEGNDSSSFARVGPRLIKVLNERQNSDTGCIEYQFECRSQEKIWLSFSDVEKNPAAMRILRKQEDINREEYAIKRISRPHVQSIKTSKQQTWAIKEVLLKHEYKWNDFEAVFYFVDWVEDVPSEWVQQSQLSFKPARSIPHWDEEMHHIPLPPLSRGALDLATAEVLVFKEYFLEELQKKIRFGWRKNEGVGDIKLGAAFFCPPTVKQYILRDCGWDKATGMGTASTEHYTFYSPDRIPKILCGPNGDDGPWWYSVEKTTLAEGDTGIETLIESVYLVSGDFTFNYIPSRHRASIQFRYSQLQRKFVGTQPTAFVTVFGSKVPLEWECCASIPELLDIVKEKRTAYKKLFSLSDLE